MNGTHETLGDMPARITLDHRLGRAFHYWLGACGQRYLHTVFRASECPAIEGSVFLAVRRDGGRRRVMAIGIVGQFGTSRDLASAVSAGANEIHLHLMTTDPAARQAAVDDLRLRHMAEAVNPPLASAA